MQPERHRGKDVVIAAARVMERANLLAAVSEEEGLLTRRFATPAMRHVSDMAAEWMREAGMSVRRDAIGNVIGRYGGSTPHVPPLVLGSHLDTVRDAGRYDGPLGVLVAIACVERLHAQGQVLPFDVEVVAFADEEGLRYQTAYLGSKAYTGAFDPAYLNMTDADGITMAEAIRAFGGDPSAVLAGRSAPESILASCEVHIEQGPVLEREGLPVGVVSAIAGQSRISLRIVGEAGHAGTVPMEMRHDAVCAAAEFVLIAEGLAREERGLVATVGQLAVLPGASNVIPGEVLLSLDVRHQDDTKREEAYSVLREEAGHIRTERHVSVEWQVVQETKSVHCSPMLTEMLGAAVEAVGYRLLHLPSGAGHDSVIMSQVAPAAMLFVRCKGGISHNPAESVEVEDVAVAIDVMGRFLQALAQSTIQIS